jgi:hypothetical protein
MNEEIQEYIKKRMTSYKCFNDFGITLYNWETELSPEGLEAELPSGFYAISELHFPTACVWTHLPESVLLTWREIVAAAAKKNFITVYRFDNHNTFVRELGAMIKDPKPWLSMGEAK